MSGEKLITTNGQSVPASGLPAFIPTTANIACATITTTGNCTVGGNVSCAGQVSGVNGVFSGNVSANVISSTTTVNGDAIQAAHQMEIFFVEAEPASPAAPGFVFYIDTLDNKLKVKGSLGTVTILAVP